MQSKFRIISILFSFGLIMLFGLLGFIVIKMMILNNDYGFWKIFGTIFLSGMCIGGLIAIKRLAKTLKFKGNKIEFHWIFRNKKIAYNYSDLVGFNWDTLRGPADYKQIKLYFRDKKIFGFSDFEYGNFYALESFIQTNFMIFRSYTKQPTDEQIAEAYQESKRLDKIQIRAIMLIIFSYWILMGFISRSLYKDLISGIDFPQGKIIFLSILFSLFIWTIYKFIKQIIRHKKISYA
ncbi:MAG: hypothetical protein K0M40_21275 [Prolixibacteraceae bacterium]|nr:hypothetical protein [Prolixibacteraceae bacterium]